MKLLSLVHRWAGAFLGLLLALLGLSGAILVWEGEWIGLPGTGDPVTEDVRQVAAITERAAATGDLSRITFASEEIGLHQVTFANGGGAYVRQDGTIVDQWSGLWERPELWLFDFHHHLFAGHTGETVTGIAGIAGLLFVVTGIILWWRSRRAFRFRLWPERLAPGPVVRQHRDLGLVAAPLLLASLLTGVMMLFEPVRSALLGAEDRPKIERALAVPTTPAAALAYSKAQFPDAQLRRISLPNEPDGSIVVRLRQSFEWTPNGRTQLSFAPEGLVTIEDAAKANASARLAEKLYPVHSAKVGGWAWKLAMTMSGLALALLGFLAVYAFWARKAGKKRQVRSMRAPSPA